MTSRGDTCYVHVEHSPGCPDCIALARSLFLSMMQSIRASVPTPAEQAVYDKMRDGYANRGPEDSASTEDLVPVVDRDGLVTQLRARSLTELLDDVESWVQGDVE